MYEAKTIGPGEAAGYPGAVRAAEIPGRTAAMLALAGATIAITAPLCGWPMLVIATERDPREGATGLLVLGWLACGAIALGALLFAIAAAAVSYRRAPPGHRSATGWALALAGAAVASWIFEWLVLVLWLGYTALSGTEWIYL